MADHLTDAELVAIVREAIGVLGHDVFARVPAGACHENCTAHRMRYRLSSIEEPEEMDAETGQSIFAATGYPNSYVDLRESRPPIDPTPLRLPRWQVEDIVARIRARRPEGGLRGRLQ